MRSSLCGSFLLARLFIAGGNCQNNTTVAVPAVPSTSLPELPSNFDDIPEKTLDCWNSYYKYSFASYFFRTEASKSAITTTETFSPPRTRSRLYTWDQEVGCATTTFGATTLCDGAPRASKRERNCRTEPTTRTELYTEALSSTTIGPSWTSNVVNPKPTCKVADDLSPLCGRLLDAWQLQTNKWRAAQTPLPKDITTSLYMAAPACTPLVNQPQPNEKLCRVSVSQYSAYHWPKPTPTGSDFCKSDWTAPTGTPTIPGQANTAVVSGHTLTSPSVYFFLKGIDVETYRGYASSLDQWAYPFGTEVWASSTAVPLETALTVAQREENILTPVVSCSGREADYCTKIFTTGFRVSDMATVRADVYKSFCEQTYTRMPCDVVVQASYTPTVALPLTEVVRQNRGIFGDCQWGLYDWKDYTHTSSSTAALEVKATATAFVAVATGGG